MPRLVPRHPTLREAIDILKGQGCQHSTLPTKYGSGHGITTHVFARFVRGKIVEEMVSVDESCRVDPERLARIARLLEVDLALFDFGVAGAPGSTP